MMNNLSSKPRYEILDGLRGVAAIIVLIYHHFEEFGPGITSFHGYLAVDFFFILSGFVVGYAYDDRWKSAANPNGMTLGGFFKRRLIRLHPLLLFGMFFGLLMFYFGGGSGLPQIMQSHWPTILISFVFAITLIPVPKMFDVRGWGEVNSFNGNSWTLGFEYLANILYALFIRHLGKTMLTLLVVLFAILTIGMGLGFDFFGIMSNRPDYQPVGTFIGGWDMNPDQVLLGWVRLLYPFFAGLLMSRILASSKISSTISSEASSEAASKTAEVSNTLLNRHGFLIASLCLSAVLLVPYLGSQEHPLYNGVYEIICILFVFPAIVYMGAKGTVSGKVHGFCKWLGDISYPLYITHSPIIFTLCIGWKANNPDATADQIVFVCCCSIILSLMVAWASLKLWDEPVRNWLKEKEEEIKTINPTKL